MGGSWGLLCPNWGFRKETGGKLNPLITRWRRRPKLAASELPTPHFCDGNDATKSPYKQLCDTNSPIQHGWVFLT